MKTGYGHVCVLFISLGHQVNVEVMLHLVGETYCPDYSSNNNNNNKKRNMRGNEQKYSLKLAKGKLMMNKIRQINVQNPWHYRFFICERQVCQKHDNTHIFHSDLRFITHLLRPLRIPLYLR